MAAEIGPGLGHVRRYWQAGLCLCCGGAHGEPPTVPVAEGVLMCQPCIERGHDEDDVLPILLEAVVRGC